MNQENFKLLKDQVKVDLEFNQENILQKSIGISNLHRKYLDFFITEFKLYKLLKSDLDKLYKEKYHFYKHEGKYQMDSFKEIEIYVKGDDDYYKASILVDEQESIVKYLEKIVELIKNLPYSIKNYVDFTKFMNGC
jgi:hypothetical protein